MIKQPCVTATLWQEITDLVSRILPDRLSWPPIVFVLCGRTDDPLDVIDYRRVSGVRAKGGDAYYYPPVKSQDYFSRLGDGKCLSGLLVVGDGLELGESDRYWMSRDRMDFGIKMHRRSPQEPWSYRVYVPHAFETDLQVL